MNYSFSAYLLCTVNKCILLMDFSCFQFLLFCNYKYVFLKKQIIISALTFGYTQNKI
jgi:hypothetical protein